VAEPADTGLKVIQAVRELVTSFTGPDADAAPALGEDGNLPTLGELTQNPNGFAQYQSIAMLAATVRWFSAESGRSEAEILEGLASNYKQ
jgi:hypothetical protein